jgi:hypothetical protein
MTSSSSARAFEPRHLQLVRALFAAVAAVMITFSPDHSAAVGLSVFSGFAMASAIVWLLSAWLVYGTGQRRLPILLGALTLIAGGVSGIPTLRTTLAFFVIVISWALVTGLIEAIAGLRRLRASERGSAARSEARDALTVGIVGVLLALGTLAVQPAYALQYSIEEAGSFTLTGITIAVGLFGGYAAIVAVYLGIAGFSPRREPASAPEEAA